MATYTPQPDKDTGWGLIFRLNRLWDKADHKALTGDYDGWELTLDRIYSNLLYREEMIINEDEAGKVLDVNLPNKDLEIWSKVKQKIKIAKKNKRYAVKIKDSKLYEKSKEDYYLSIFYYDIWLRKFMQSLGGMYIKEIESNPSKALFGGAFKK